MKRRILSFGLISVLAGLLFSSCTPPLLYETTIPAFNAPAERALCVIIRHTGMYSSTTPIWLDTKCVAGTEGNTVTSFEVEPGEHLVITKFSFKTKVKFNFQAGKVYYIVQTTFPIPLVGPSTSLSHCSGADAAAILEKETGNLKYTRLNPSVSQSDLSEGDIKDELEDWAKWAKKEPEKAKLEIEYPGY